jgi:hypothetical protein
MAAPPRTRSLWPREHGAYAQLLVPLITALVATRPTLASASIALGACLAFLASEPLLVVIGGRGPRAREHAGARARWRVLLLGSPAAIAGVCGLVLAPAARVPAIVAGLIAIVVLGAAWKRRVQTVAGETLAATALAAAAMPVAVAGGIAIPNVLAIWAAWSIGYASTVVAVHHVLARHRRPARPADRAWAGGLVVLMLASVALARWQPAALIATPLIAVSAGLVVRPPRATRLRAVGTGFVIASLLAAVYAVLVVRLG